MKKSKNIKQNTVNFDLLEKRVNSVSKQHQNNMKDTLGPGNPNKY